MAFLSLRAFTSLVLNCVALLLKEVTEWSSELKEPAAFSPLDMSNKITSDRMLVDSLLFPQDAKKIVEEKSASARPADEILPLVTTAPLISYEFARIIAR